MLKKILEKFKGLHLYIKIGIIAVALIISGSLYYSVNTYFENRRIAAYEKKQKEQDAKIAGLETKNKRLEEDIKKNEELIISKDEQLNSYRKIIEENNVRLSKKQIQHMAILKNYEKVIKDIDNDTDTSIYDRCISVCAEKQKLGYKCDKAICDKYK